MGKSGLVGHKIAATLSSTGTRAFFMHPAEAYHGDLGMIDPEDAVIAISNSGETSELLKLLSFFKENKIPAKVTETNDFVVYDSDIITIFSGDFFKLNQEDLGEVDAVYDRAALIALPQDVRKLYASHLTDLMSPKTAMFLITTPYDQDQMPGPPFSVDEDEVKRIYGEHFNINQLYNSTLNDVPAHLKEKGLVQAKEQVYTLISKKN
jgi:thiopurine S-methyltransferase